MVCRSKHVEPSVNFGIINSIKKLHLVGISLERFRSLLPSKTSVYLSATCLHVASRRQLEVDPHSHPVQRIRKRGALPPDLKVQIL